ncbi:MAG: hypothetical protein FJX71_05340 [Alphaproteobacteria bacterium]|nr:hypothetical protein [Alphaproteobacteria bacterium]
MSDVNTTPHVSGSRNERTMSDPTRGMIFQIIQSSANDNLMPAMKWFTWLISWTIVVGGALAYAIF